MLLGCWYHLLDSAFPLSSVGDGRAVDASSDGKHDANNHGRDDFLRLEYLSACKIMESIVTANRVLPHVPHRFYPALLQAVIQKQFNIWRRTRDSLTITPSLSIVSLLENWPYEELALKDLIPSLPLPFSRKTFAAMSMKAYLGELNHFFIYLFNIIPFTFISRCRSIDERTEYQYKLRRLNVSGFYGFFCDYRNLKNLERKVKDAYDPNCAPNYAKDEIVIDVQAIPGDHESVGTLGVICTLSSHHGARLVVKFRRVNLTSAVYKSIIAIIDLLAKNNVTEYLELEACEVNESVVAKLDILSKTLVGLGLSYSIGFNSSLEFLTHMPNLSQLDLSGILLNGKIAPLADLPQSLNYLKLVGCRIRHSDLDVLINSKHTKSLLQLDLSENSFGLPVEMEALFNLLMDLSQVQILELENCKFNRYTPENVRRLVDILKTLPSLRVLVLTGNDFSSRLLRDTLPHLACNKSLQCLKLTVPSDAYLSDDYNTIAREIERLQSDFSQRMLLVADSHLQVGWSEEITHSHWYYSV